MGMQASPKCIPALKTSTSNVWVQRVKWRDAWPLCPYNGKHLASCSTRLQQTFFFFDEEECAWKGERETEGGQNSYKYSRKLLLVLTKQLKRFSLTYSQEKSFPKCKTSCQERLLVAIPWVFSSPAFVPPSWLRWQQQLKKTRSGSQSFWQECHFSTRSNRALPSLTFSQ